MMYIVGKRMLSGDGESGWLLYRLPEGPRVMWASWQQVTQPDSMMML